MIVLFDPKLRNVLVVSKFDMYLSEVIIKIIDHIYSQKIYKMLFLIIKLKYN